MADLPGLQWTCRVYGLVRLAILGVPTPAKDALYLDPRRHKNSICDYLFYMRRAFLTYDNPHETEAARPPTVMHSGMDYALLKVLSTLPRRHAASKKKLKESKSK